ncbi:tetratricopeptide repeat protein [Aquimarina sediminis]|uniref:tetratricopeptide repeat protein n=1 Tax=Aquimarina sediminis TaxID=2070536 RepID=UPI000CA016D6|nr:tetratricopeptide repeat protein [Aquimarina sediminis]
MKKLLSVTAIMLYFVISCMTVNVKNEMTDYQKAQEIKEKIDRGDLMIGLLDTTEVVEMIDLYTKSANSGNSAGWYQLGMIYYVGIGVDQDADKAISYFKQAAEAEYGIDAWIKYIRICYFANLTTVPSNKIIDLVEELEKKDASGEVSLLKGYMLYRGYAYTENLEASFLAHHASATKGNSDAMFELCVYYTQGIGVEEDAQKALQWCIKAAENNNLRALYNLGTYYATGYENIPKDSEKAISYYTKAANLGHGKAAAQVAAMYILGDGVEKDEELAKKFYELAFENDFDVDIFFESLGLEEID